MGECGVATLVVQRVRTCWTRPPGSLTVGRVWLATPHSFIFTRPLTLVETDLEGPDVYICFRVWHTHEPTALA